MPRLIDANDIKYHKRTTCGGHGLYYDETIAYKEDIDSLPTVDAVEVKHGRWQPHYEIFDADPAVGILGGNYQTGWQCSVCGRYESIQEPYCNCGAKMDGDGNG